MSLGAATVVARRGLILGVSRGGDFNDWGLPGGMVERGENPEDAARRELWEETGVDAHDAQLVPVLESGFLHRSVIYVAQGRLWVPPELGGTTWEGHVAWLPPHAFLGRRCTFWRDNRVVFRRLGLS